MHVESVHMNDPWVNLYLKSNIMDIDVFIGVTLYDSVFTIGTLLSTVKFCTVFFLFTIRCLDPILNFWLNSNHALHDLFGGDTLNKIFSMPGVKLETLIKGETLPAVHHKPGWSPFFISMYYAITCTIFSCVHVLQNYLVAGKSYVCINKCHDTSSLLSRFIPHIMLKVKIK